MNKASLIMTGILCVALTSRAVLPVTDYGLIIQSEINWVQGFAKQVLQYEQELQIQINTLNTYEQEVVQVVRMGNPATYISPIINDVNQVVGGLSSTEQSLVSQYEQLESLASPQTYQNTMNSVMSQFQLPQWTGNVSTLGIVTTPCQANYQFQTAQYSAEIQTQKLIQSIEVQKAEIIKSISTLNSAASSATTTAEGQKLQSSIAVLQAALSSLDSRESQLRQQALMFSQQISSAQALYKTAQAEQMAAGFQQAQEAGLSSSTNTIAGNATEFGAIDNPATGGSGDPGTTGNWYTGAGGADIGSKNAFGVSLPASTEIAQFGSTSAAMGQMVTVTDPSTGNTITAPILDVGPGAAAVAKGAVVDLTYAAARQIGINGNPLHVQVSFPSKVQ